MGKCYLFHFGYNGSRYHGWQKQPDQLTVQQTIYEAMESLFPKGRIKVFAASRTDAGVHALGQTCKLDLPCRLEAGDLLRKTNEQLPPDIIVFDARRIAPSFRITDYVVSKEYLYFFSSKKSDLPFVTSLEEELDIEKMIEGSRQFLGEHDFGHYQYRSQVKGDHKRSIYECGVVKGTQYFSQLPDDIWVFHVKGNGFLKQMVRLMMGALINLASSKITLEELKLSLQTEGRPIGFIAPAKGLILYKIDYPDWQDEKNQPVIDHQKWREWDLPWGFFPQK